MGCRTKYLGWRPSQRTTTCRASPTKEHLLQTTPVSGWKCKITPLLSSALTPSLVDGQNPAPPEKPWNDDSPGNTNKYWFQPWFLGKYNQIMASTMVSQTYTIKYWFQPWFLTGGGLNGFRPLTEPPTRLPWRTCRCSPQCSLQRARAPSAELLGWSPSYVLRQVLGWFAGKTKGTPSFGP